MGQVHPETNTVRQCHPAPSAPCIRPQTCKNLPACNAWVSPCWRHEDDLPVDQFCFPFNVVQIFNRGACFDTHGLSPSPSVLRQIITPPTGADRKFKSTFAPSTRECAPQRYSLAVMPRPRLFPPSAERQPRWRAPVPGVEWHSTAPLGLDSRRRKGVE